MKWLLVFLALMGLLIAGCVSTSTPDVNSIVQVAIAATLTAQPTVIPTQMPTSEPIPTIAPPPTEISSLTSPYLETYYGRGFLFQYPVNALLQNVAPTLNPWEVASSAVDELHVIGSEVWVNSLDADYYYRGPAYELIIRTYENPEGLDAESWARNYVLTSWQEAVERNVPSGALPVSEKGEIKEHDVGRSIVAGQPAFWVNYFGFDSSISAYYLTSNHQVIELLFSLYPLENQPLAMVQQDIYALILSTFRLEGD